MRATSLILAATAALAAGCGRSPDKKGPFVAQGQGVAVTVEELRARLEEQPPAVRARYATLERKREFLENLIRFELLAHEAAAQKLEQDPEAHQAIRTILVQRLVRKALDEKEGVKATEADARAYYDDHLDEFVRPERLRLSHVFFRAPAGAPDRARRQAEAERASNRLKQESGRSPLAFANLARDASDDQASKAAGGDLGARSADELTRQWSAELTSAATALKEVGQETGVVATPQGFHLLKLTGRQPALARSFEDAKAQLVARLGRERRAKDFEQFLATLRTKAGVTIDEAALDRVLAVTPGEARAGPGPSP